jgi:hypothetical protein
VICIQGAGFVIAGALAVVLLRGVGDLREPMSRSRVAVPS